MKSALIHGVLLAVMLVYGYRTWTRDKTVKPDYGNVVLWDKTDADLKSIEFKTEKKTVLLERKVDGDKAYWWGTETSLEKKPKPKPPEPKKDEPPPAPVPGPAGSGSAGSGSAAPPPKLPPPAAKTGELETRVIDTPVAWKAPGDGAGGSGSAKPPTPPTPPAAGSGSAAKVPAAGSGSGSAKPPTPGSGAGAPATGSGSGSVGSGSGSAAPPPTPKPPPAPVEMIESIRKREFPLGDGGDKVVKGYTEARAVRDLGQPNPERLVDYKLADRPTLDARAADLKKQISEIKLPEKPPVDKTEKPEKPEKPDKTAENKKKELEKKLKDVEDQKKQLDTTGRPTLTISFTDGTNRAFLVGGSVYGGSDRYVLDKTSGVAYVLAKDIIAGLEIGESSLQLTDPRGFDATKIETVEIDWNGRKKLASRSVGADDDKKVKTWVEADTKKTNAAMATFIDNINNMKPTEYALKLDLGSVQPIMRLTYRDATKGTLGTLALYKVEKPGVLPDGVDLDPSNPPKGETEYYVLTERTRVPALVRKDPAQRSENDLPIVFGDKAAPIEPKGDPFKNVPLPKPGGHGASPHGGAPPPGSPFGAPPAGSGTLPKPAGDGHAH